MDSKVRKGKNRRRMRLRKSVKSEEGGREGRGRDNGGAQERVKKEEEKE